MILRCAAIAVLSIVGIVGCAGLSPKELTIMEKPERGSEDVLFWCRWWLEQIQPNGFLPIDSDEELRYAERVSPRELEDLFNPVANPYAPGRATRHSFFIGNEDVVRHEYEVSGLKLTVLETAGEILTRVDVDLGPPTGHAQATQRIAAILFRRGNMPIHVFSSKAKDESMRFSTDSRSAMGLPPWGTIGGGITAGRIYFILGKFQMPGQRGPGDVDRDNWLRGPLRAAWDAQPKRP